MAHYGPMSEASLAKRRATAAGKPWGFARWSPEKRAAVQRLGVEASKPYAGRWTKAQATAMSRKGLAKRWGAPVQQLPDEGVR